VAANKPTRADLLAAAGKTVPDVITTGLRVLFCGINPGLYSAAIQHHFGRPGNRFWPALHLGGFTPRQFSPYEERELLPLGYGITNIVERSSATAGELELAELLAGGQQLRAKVLAYQPAYLAILGVTAYRTAFQQPQAGLGLQTQRIAATQVWVLPNPSGLNAHYRLAGLGLLFAELRGRAIDGG
jgi:TDG/mug DNA glycosylase family protein